MTTIEQCQECGKFTEIMTCYFEGNIKELCADCVPQMAMQVPLLVLLESKNI
jgi:hypothetical protein